MIVGPTAVGKSSLANALAERVGGEIVVADSLQVYRGLDIGTAKASAEEQQRVPHHLLDLVDPDMPFSAADYARLARATIDDIRGRGHLPIMVGGTGLYVRAFLRGLFDGPMENVSVREALRQEATRVGVPGLHQRLQALDPEAAAAIHPNDLFRIVRALEVTTLAGRPISAMRKESRRHHEPVCGPVLRFGLERHREELYRRIEMRVEEMLARGFLDEVRGLLDRGYSPTLRPLRAFGYRHMIEHLEGRATLDEVVSRLKRDTRRYAKRQLTWFRHEDGIEWCHVEGSDGVKKGLSSLAERIEGVWARAV
ncbi:MAG: tRNA (adenosine(37)-N6)-dimethylallyltransferase MiaA [Candidatus Methylomirabilis sp.]